MTKPTITTQELQRRIGHRAKSAPEHRFWGLYVHLVKLDTLEVAYLEAKRNRGAPGTDGETFEMIEERGRGEFLTGLAAELRDGTYKPRPYRRREIPKEGGKVRVISIPTIRDRVVQGALRRIASLIRRQKKEKIGRRTARRPPTALTAPRPKCREDYREPIQTQYHPRAGPFASPPRCLSFERRQPRLQLVVLCLEPRVLGVHASPPSFVDDELGGVHVRVRRGLVPARYWRSDHRDDQRGRRDEPSDADHGDRRRLAADRGSRMTDGDSSVDHAAEACSTLWSGRAQKGGT